MEETPKWRIGLRTKRKFIFFLLHTFWLLGDTMLRVQIGPMQTCVTKKPKTAQAGWKIRILGDWKLGDLVQAEINWNKLRNINYIRWLKELISTFKNGKLQKRPT